jgi:AcrR family transcriptional regulator
VSPRPYRLGQRQDSVDRTRRGILAAARGLLADPDPGGGAAFTVDAVARRADVARATVYYRFGSKAGLLEALFDDLAAGGRLADLATAFTAADPDEALRRFVACFAGFWAGERTVLRRVRALAALDPEVAPVIAARDERRRDGVRVLLARRATALPAARVSSQPPMPRTAFQPSTPPAPHTLPSPPAAPAILPTSAPDEALVALVHTLTSFETFDTLAGPDRDPRELAPLVADLILRALAAPAPPTPRAAGSRADTAP